jgi:hypothetical protein
VARNVLDFLFADLPALRRRELISAVAHFVAGVLDQESMVAVVESLSQSMTLAPGDRVMTLRGSLRGEVLQILEDGRVEWRAETGTVFIGLPETLQHEG